MKTSTQKYFSYFQSELTAWKSFLILTTSLMLFACNVEVVSTNAPENKCAIPDYAQMNPKECGRNGAANSKIPILSFDSVSTTEGLVGKLISISPSRLETNGSDIKACKITPDLPAALTINSSTCVISGTPNAVLASTTYAVIATNSAGPSLPAIVTIKVGASAPTLSYSGAAGTNATVGSLMSVKPTTLSPNGASITSCAVKSGTTALPSWASVNPSTCVISGTPNAVLASTSYTLVATNSVGQSADAAVTLSVAAAVPSLSYSNSSGRIGTVNTPMTITPSTFSANGASITGCAVKLGTTALPAWASLNTTTCVISGTPNAVMASKSYTLVATNSVGQSADAAISLSVAAIPSLSYSGASGRNGTFGTLMTVNPTTLLANEASITACGIKVPTTALPSWASVNPTTCVISGTPSAVLASTTYTLVATNSVGQSGDATVTLSVAAVVPALSYSNSSGRSGTVNTPMTVNPSTLSANGAQITGCAVKSGTTALPAWASVNATTCVISGTPNGSLTSTTYTIVATNSVGQSADALVSLSVGTNILTPIAIEAFPDTTNHPAVTWTPNVRFSSVTNDNIGLYSDTLGTLINTPVTATAGLNTFLANPVTSLGQTNTIYAKNPSSSSYTTMGTYRTKLPPNMSLLGVSGEVRAAIRDSVSPGCTASPGCMVIAGKFTVAGGVPTKGIARWNPTTSAWSALGSGTSGEVYALAIDNSGNIYAGGWFNTAGGVVAKNIAMWNTTNSTWNALGSGTGYVVNALTIDGSGNIYAGGWFSSAGGTSANYIARWNPTTSTWSTLGTGMNNAVNALAADTSGNLYAGGSFTTAGGVSANRIARWNPTTSTWSALGAGTSGDINALTFDSSGNLYAGGTFTTAGAVGANNIARWNPTTSTWSAFSTGTNGNVNAFALDSSGYIYVGGHFTSAGGVSAYHIAMWNPSTSAWSALGYGMGGRVQALAIDGGRNLYVGGSFGSTGGDMVAHNIARWNPTTSTWTSLGAGIDGRISALAVDSSGHIYAGGGFTTIGGVSARVQCHNIHMERSRWRY